MQVTGLASTMLITRMKPKGAGRDEHHRGNVS